MQLTEVEFTPIFANSAVAFGGLCDFRLCFVEGRLVQTL